MVNCMLVCLDVCDTVRMFIFASASDRVAQERIPGLAIFEPIAQTIATFSVVTSSNFFLQIFYQLRGTVFFVYYHANGIGIGYLIYVTDVMVLENLHDFHIKAYFPNHVSVMDFQVGNNI